MSVTLASPIGNVTFSQDTTPRSADLNNFFFDSTTFANDLTYTATVDNRTLEQATINGSTLTVTQAAGGSGYAHVRVTAKDPFGGTASDVFRIKITAAPNRSLDVPIGSGRRDFTFVQADQSAATILLLGPGSGTVHMGGDNLKLVGRHLTGANQELESITLSGTTAATQLLIVGHSRRLLPGIGDITTDGALEALTLRNCQLIGDVSIARGLGAFDANFALSGSISIGMSSRPMPVQLGVFEDENFTSGTPIRAMGLSQWINTDNSSETISLPYIGKLLAFGSFTEGLQLSGAPKGHQTLGKNLIFGGVGGTWNVAGAAAQLSVGTINSDWNATFSSLGSLTDFGQFLGTLTAPRLQSLRVRFGMINATVTLTGAGGTDLNFLQIKENMTNSTIMTAGSIGTSVIGLMQQSTIFAAVNSLATGQALPASASDFSGPAKIDLISLHPRPGFTGFVNSRIAASHIGNLLLNSTKSSNGGMAFGVAAMGIGHIEALDLTQHRLLNFSNLTDPAAFAALLAAQGINLADMQIQLIS